MKIRATRLVRRDMAVAAEREWGVGTTSWRVMMVV